MERSNQKIKDYLDKLILYIREEKKGKIVINFEGNSISTDYIKCEKENLIDV